MKSLFIFFLLFIQTPVFGDENSDIDPIEKMPKRYVVVSNRSDSSITILSTPEGKILKKITSEETGFEFEPIYASAIPRFHALAVSDRKNNQVIFFDDRTLKYLGFVPASRGMFHMWPTPEQKEIFVVADIDRVVDVLEVNRFGDKILFKKRKLNPGAIFDSGKPHDIVVDKNFIFVTMIGVLDSAGRKMDYLLKYSRKTFKLLATKPFSFDIHLGIPSQSPYLLVPEQTAGQLNFVNKKTMKIDHKVKDLPGAHGIYWNADASKAYLANFVSTGPMSVYEVRQTLGDETFKSQKLSVHELENAKAHNITVDFKEQVMFVTHSGPNNDGELNRMVSFFSVKGKPVFIKTVETGVNPLGILLIERR